MMVIRQLCTLVNNPLRFFDRSSGVGLLEVLG